MNKTNNMKIEIKYEVSMDTIASLLCCAFEGGSNYWYFIENCKAPKTLSYKMDGPDGTTFPHIDYPLNEGGELEILDMENKKKSYKLNLAIIKKGWKVFAEKYPWHFANAIVECHADAETGDVFLQCCLFGELIYG